MIIMSASNERLKSIKKLLNSAKERKRQGLYVVENIRMFREIPKEEIELLIVSQTAEKRYEKELSDWGKEYLLVSDGLFSDLSDTKTPQGILAAVRQKHYSMEDVCRFAGDRAPFLLVLASIQDPGNMGTVLRTAEGAGVTGVIISADSVDLYNPKTVRATMGSILRMPVYISEDLKADLSDLKKRGIRIFGAHLDGEIFYKKDFKKPCAFLIGNEGNGLSPEIGECADELLKIPMLGEVESLNAAISAAVLSYEVLRQRMF